MNPTLYDILGVPQDASREEVRKAWREAADRFEPGEGGATKQFRLFNEAAEVLLDPERRKAYDDSLDAGGSHAEPANPPPPPATPPPVPGSPVPGTARATTQAAPDPPPAFALAADEDDSSSSARRTVPWPVLAVLGVLAAVAIGFAAYFVTQAQRAAEYQEALDRAPAAAESAASAVLAYDHESLAADRDAAAKFLSDGYRGDYVKTFDKLVMDTAKETKATVEAEVLASSAMLGGGDRDPDRVPVLLFVNQSTTSTASSGEPSVALNRVRFDMVEVDGTWLVDGITSY